MRSREIKTEDEISTAVRFWSDWVMHPPSAQPTASAATGGQVKAVGEVVEARGAREMKANMEEPVRVYHALNVEVAYEERPVNIRHSHPQWLPL